MTTTLRKSLFYVARLRSLKSNTEDDLNLHHSNAGWFHSPSLEYKWGNWSRKSAILRAPMESISIPKINLKPLIFPCQTKLFTLPWRPVCYQLAIGVCECSVVSESFAIPCAVAHQAPLSMGLFQSRMLEWTAISSSRGSSQPRDQTPISCTGRRVLYHWATIGGLIVNTSPRQVPSQGVPILPLSLLGPLSPLASIPQTGYILQHVLWRTLQKSNHESTTTKKEKSQELVKFYYKKHRE